MAKNAIVKAVKDVGPKIIEKAGPTTAKVAFKAKKNAPVICLVSGLGLIVVGTVAACKQTVKFTEDMEETFIDIEADKTLINHQKEIDKEVAKDPEAKFKYPVQADIPEVQRNIRRSYLKLAQQGARRYAVPAACIVVGATLIIVGHKIEAARLATAIASYEALNQAFESYRSRVIKEHGPAADYRYMTGTEEVKADIYKEDEETGKVKKTKETVVGYTGESGSPYAVIFNRENAPGAWEDDYSSNRYVIDTVNVYLNERLRRNGYVFLSEAYDSLGLPYKPVGQLVGWILGDEEGDGEIHIYMTELFMDEEIERARAEKRNPCPELLLDFNVQGVIYDKL